MTSKLIPSLLFNTTYSLEKIFDTLINSFIESKIGLSNNFLGESLANNLKQNLLGHYENKMLAPAGIGNLANVGYNTLFRSDIIYWLDRGHNNVHENNFFNLVDDFVRYLNATCYTGITGYEFHYTLYPKGSFYKRHLDQFRNNDSRKYSMIMYLNDDWKNEDGGELCVYQQDGCQYISPTNGKSVFFKSNEMEHEVLITHKPRLSITGWLKS